MKNLKVASAQFEPADGDKERNFSIMEDLISRAADQKVDLICFHELCITAYTHLKNLDKDEIIQLSEPVPDGPSCERLVELSEKYNVGIMAGLVEKAGDKFYNTYVCAYGGSIISRFRKIHPFISTFLSAGDSYEVFEFKNWKVGILICYDNNVIENVRATRLLGADVIIAPHVTGCTPSSMPGRGYVDDELWKKRNENPEDLKEEFNGRKGRQWILRWLPARAYDNGVYYVFSNPIGYDGEHLKNGNAMILDPYGDILAETSTFDSEIAIAELTPEKLNEAGGSRYLKARRPELYSKIIGANHTSETKPIWLEENDPR